MKPVTAGPAPGHQASKHPDPLGTQQAVAEKASGNTASVKARIDSQNMPDKPVLHRQHTPNSSGRK